MKTKALALVSLLLVVAVFSSPLLIPTAEGQEVSDIKVLMIITDAFGWNYFDAKEILESWGVNVTTAAHALDTDIASCYNRAPRGTTADFLLNAVENDIVTQFDALFIPSGGHWAGLIGSSRVLDFISFAHEQGVIIATTCIGNRVVAESNEIVNGTSVVNYNNPNSFNAMVEAGAIIRYGYDAITDNGIITGDSGGGPTGGGYIHAPTSEICVAIIREALGNSYVEQAEVLPLVGESGTSFNISADITDLDSELGDLFSVDINITEVHARIFTKENRTLVETIELTDADEDMVYTGSYNGTINGDYVIDIEVEDTNSTLEIERESASFTVGIVETSTTTSTTGTGLELDSLMLGGIAMGGLLIVIVAVVVLKKR
ncbi:MAG: DJ-1/PfpI family protein [Candidatus Thorarchaeota archaeon]|nr:DJ-1/PfpI family protein [Candidatus Thorarchaeota archaeon]